MKKFEGMILACDMDGTLLDDDREISQENEQALTQAGPLRSVTVITTNP